MLTSCYDPRLQGSFSRLVSYFSNRLQKYQYPSEGVVGLPAPLRAPQACCPQVTELWPPRHSPGQTSQPPSGSVIPFLSCMPELQLNKCSGIISWRLVLWSNTKMEEEDLDFELPSMLKGGVSGLWVHGGPADPLEPSSQQAGPGEKPCCQQRLTGALWGCRAPPAQVETE